MGRARHRAFIGLGGNLGDVRQTLRQALGALANRDTRVVAASRAYRTRAVLAPGATAAQPDYWNAVAELSTRLPPRALLERLLELEREAGRVRREPWGQRPLDLDLLTYDDLVLDEPGLSLPHPRLATRAFVLVPLAERWPDLVIPGQGRANDLLQHLPRTPGDVLESAELPASPARGRGRRPPSGRG